MILYYFLYNPPKSQMQGKTARNKTRGLKKWTNKPAVQLDPPYSQQLSRRLSRCFSSQRISFLKEKLSNYFGKNFVIDYQDRFNFQEEWEQNVSNSSRIESQSPISEKPLEIGASILIAIILTVSLWISSIDLVFHNSHTKKHEAFRFPYSTIYIITICALLLDELFILKNKIRRKTLECSPLSFLKNNYRQLICLTAYLLKIILDTPNQSTIWILFEATSLILVYIRAKELYASLRLISYSLYYEYHSKICDMIITLFLILHTAAIVLYLSTFTGYDKTWLNSLDLGSGNEFILYIYSFYYGSTTILTVGYGDICPKNPLEVTLIILIQIVGIATHGFIISQINYCVSNLRKNSEIIEKDLSIVLKMKNHYKMKDNFIKEARSFIINNKPKVDQLYPHEEKYLLQKFNEELRNNISAENTLSVIKSSIFFITRWSINFQRSVSTKLQHILFSPNDLLYQPKLNPRIYIVKSGKINIYAEKNGRKQGQKNLLKTIENNDRKEISDNCYGYTGVISTRPSRLYAIAKDITSAYYIDKDKFLKCLSQRISDSQYYHQIKSKMDQESHWQIFEAPLVGSSKHHYNPTKKHIIRNSNMNSEKNQQRFYNGPRVKKRMKLTAITDEHQGLCLRCKLGRGDSQNIASYPYLLPRSTDTLQNETEGGLLKAGETKEAVSEATEVIQLEQDFSHGFEAGKQYVNYFPRQNQSAIIKKLERQYVIPHSNHYKQAELGNTLYQALTTPKIQVK